MTTDAFNGDSDINLTLLGTQFWVRFRSIICFIAYPKSCIKWKTYAGNISSSETYHCEVVRSTQDLCLLATMRGSQSKPQTEEFSRASSPHANRDAQSDSSNVERALLDWQEDSNGCISSTGTRFYILWGVTVIVLVFIVMRQWYRSRRVCKATKEVNCPVTDDLESRKCLISNTRG
ncbi:uncharacterized protein EV420DRAFT_205076 [Desarmillaria tabescens]|uniref:Uncharacterized protein n=1 Tax=Armillaria tabescens TaxID=1929756 RepID=A0AA39MJE9_ARMTA|nr:uncharacterized protein EV420DRAFT_205076 [Desarmillaria tabescens]KAK0437086.1 hypothetical protein EV420DRAFT_205076 [Desarmillaria tabescens]